MGLTGLEPVTLRLSSACSNQLSYRPALRDDAQKGILDAEGGRRKGVFWDFVIVSSAAEPLDRCGICG